MALPQEPFYTLEDIYALPDGKRAELLDGQIYNMAPPSRVHQEIVQFMTKNIGYHIDKKNGSCKVYPAPFAVFLTKDNSNYVEPDVSVICDKDKLDERGCNGAPDWIIEVISPSSKRMDRSIKLFKYRSAGVREYWMIDPNKNTVTVYFFEEDFVEDYTLSDMVPAHIYEDLEIDFSVLDLS
ncbi:MAG: Uma2 family endonuclease [Lachnospiraceae bacterium]|nr:Uma2 family endonuclease [Lachnospiraceae bacterium]MBQ5851628.1 Uma2 family endonuclease [Lachnospiraceae bacterium]